MKSILINYEDADIVAKYCREELKYVERQIKQLTGNKLTPIMNGIFGEDMAKMCYSVEQERLKNKKEQLEYILTLMYSGSSNV